MFRVILAATALSAAMIPAALAEDFATYSGEAAAPVDHSIYASFLDRYVRAGDDGLNRVAYASVTPEDHRALKGYIGKLTAMDPTTLSRDEAFAYWANLYNAVTLDVVLDEYPVESIRDIRSGFRAGPWKKNLVRVSGEKLSLDDIEHGILREHWDEPRVHFAVNCASVGCPNLATKPFTGEGLDAQLDAATKDYVNSPRGFTTGGEDGTDLIASSIFDWYAEDFGGGAKGVLAFARPYAEGPTTHLLDGARTIDGYDYDWALNEAR